jgi:DNA-directed RNA polymerase specialized sigma24 family protein
MWTPDWLKTAIPSAETTLRSRGWPAGAVPNAVQEAAHRAAAVVAEAASQGGVPNWENELHFTNWLTRVGHNFLVTDSRRRRRFEPLPTGSEPSGCCAEYAGLADDLNDSLARLTPERREVWLRYHRDQEQMTDIARSLGLPVRTAFRRLAEATRLLEDSMAARGWSAEDLDTGWR